MGIDGDHDQTRVVQVVQGPNSLLIESCFCAGEGVYGVDVDGVWQFRCLTLHLACIQHARLIKNVHCISKGSHRRDKQQIEVLQA